MARLFLRIDLGAERLLGPGKVRLLEMIDEVGSIAAAGRALEMSYRRAWLLVDETNRCFSAPVVEARPGGKAGGGTQLTAFGREVVAHYRAIERRAAAAAADDLEALQAAAAERLETPGGTGDRARDCRGGTARDDAPNGRRSHKGP
ncbi:MAG: winged helix-turn-helix domain-containing protein [Alphaproteobacteria bacterium]